MFTTGQFSKLAFVSKRLLHHYDEVGLFTPVRVDPVTKTRFYSMEQLPFLSQILALKELGVPLERVGTLVRGGLHREELQRLLEAERKRIQSNLEREEMRLRALESRLRTLEVAEGSQEGLVVKPVPALPALSIRQTFDSIPDVFGFLMQLAAEGPGLLGKRPGRLFATNHCDGYEIEGIDGELGWILEEPVEDAMTLSSGIILEPKTLASAGAVISCVHPLTDEDAHSNFAALGLWMERTGHEMTGPCREVFLQPPGPNRIALVESQFPVRLASA